jgi:2-polyprenyl-3-methyl-5-hydroxy-6-metoxy-1,4-benzoquinol methylase
MAPMMRQPAAVMAAVLHADAHTPWKVLDIAAGHGLFGITLAQRNPNAEIVAVDWPNVLEVATGNAQAAGVATRYRTIPGSAFAVEYGTGYDLALVTNFLHHFDPSTGVQLLRKVHAALAPEGRAVILELVPNDDRVTPPLAAMFALTMLATTPHGEAYPFSEYRRMLKDAGFSGSELHEVPPADGRAIIIAYKAGR